MEGNLIAVVGVMGSGKTERLIGTYHSCLNDGLNVGVFKPLIDTRTKLNKVCSRSGKCIPAISIQSLDEIYEYESESEDAYDVILIDEIQFFGEGSYEVLESLTLLGIDVYVFGLDVTSENKTFGDMGNILAHADQVIKLEAPCARCGGPARISHYKGHDKDSDIKIGDLDMYEPLCRHCYEEELREKGMKEVDETYYFTLEGEGFFMELMVSKSALEAAGYTYHDVLDINTLEGAKNLLEDLGYGGDWFE